MRTNNHKFKKGDWIVFTEDFENFVTFLAYKVTRVCDTGYMLLHNHTFKSIKVPFDYENKMRYWTIKDATRHQMLITRGKTIFGSNGAISKNGYVVVENCGAYIHIESINDVFPTTLRQRRNYFKKLDEKGIGYK